MTIRKLTIDESILLKWQRAKLRQVCTDDYGEEFTVALRSLLLLGDPNLKTLAIEANLKPSKTLEELTALPPGSDQLGPALRELDVISDRREAAQLKLLELSYRVAQLFPDISEQTH